MEQGGERGSGIERELCPKQAAIKRALKKGQKKNEKEAHTQQAKQIRQLKVRDERAVDIL